MTAHRPLDIPPTSSERYISFFHALNLREPNEDTGDWHFKALWYDMADDPSHRQIALAGEGGCRINTNPILGNLGVREMGSIVLAQKLTETRQDVYVANHYRAVADLFAGTLQRPRDIRALKRQLTNREINAWFDTKDQIATLKAHYLEPMIDYSGATERATVREWLDHICWD